MDIYLANSRKETNWKSGNIDFLSLAEKLKVPERTSETYNEFQNFSKETQDEIKDVGGYFLGKLRNGKRRKDSVISRSGIYLDIDFIPNEKEMNSIINRIRSLGYRYIIHSTKKHSLTSPRLRVIFELDEAVNPEAYEFIAYSLCEQIGMKYFDKTTVEPNRFMYWPSICSDMQDQYYFESFINHTDISYTTLNGEAFLANFQNWKDRRTWPKFESEEKEINSLIKDKQADPLQKTGLIGIFCRTYTIHEAIEKFLNDIYIEGNSVDRYSYAKGSTSNGAIVYEDKFLYSFHATDPAGNRLCNAFDLVRIHKFGNNKNSINKMLKFITQDSRVKEESDNENINKLVEKYKADKKGIITTKEVDEYKEAQKRLWNILERDKNDPTKPASTIDNILKILRYDPAFKNAFYYDLFSKRMIITKSLPWDKETKKKREWSDIDDSGLLSYLEKIYQLNNEAKMYHAFSLAKNYISLHPIKEYLEGLKWDGVSRIDYLLQDYFGAENNSYTQDIMRKSLIACIARIYEPGIKFDSVLILIGKQGLGKSTFFKKLGMEWFSDSVTDFKGKEAYEQIQNAWIIELGELSGMNRYEMNDVKHFLSKCEDSYREPYARRTENHKRQCVFFGTTNNQEFLRDNTGNRRFWPIDTGIYEPIKSVFTDLDNEVDQIWAEAYSYYLIGEDLFLKDESLKISEKEQDSRMYEDPQKDMIIDYLCLKVPMEWKEWDLTARRMYLNVPEERKGYSEYIYRDHITSCEIACELFNWEISDLDTIKIRKVSDVLQSIKGLSKLSNPYRVNKFYGRKRGYFINLDEFLNAYSNH